MYCVCPSLHVILTLVKICTDYCQVFCRSRSLQSTDRGLTLPRWGWAKRNYRLTLLQSFRRTLYFVIWPLSSSNKVIISFLKKICVCVCVICHKGVTYITKWQDTTEMTTAQFAETSIIVKNSPIQDNRMIIFHLIVCFEIQIRKTFWTPVSASPVISFGSLCLICTFLCLPATVWKPILWTGSNLCTQKIRTMHT